MDHTDANKALDRLQREQEILRQMRTRPITEPTHAALALQQAKRVRATSNLVVRALARLRDQLQPKEGTSE